MIEFNLTVFMCSHCTRVHNCAEDCLLHERVEHSAGDKNAAIVDEDEGPDVPLRATETPHDVSDSTPIVQPTDQPQPIQKRKSILRTSIQPHPTPGGSSAANGHDSDVSFGEIDPMSPKNSTRSSVKRAKAAKNNKKTVSFGGEDDKPLIPRKAHVCEPCGRKFHSKYTFAKHVKVCSKITKDERSNKTQSDGPSTSSVKKVNDKKFKVYKYHCSACDFVAHKHSAALRHERTQKHMNNIANEITVAIPQAVAQ